MGAVVFNPFCQRVGLVQFASQGSMSSRRAGATGLLMTGVAGGADGRRHLPGHGASFEMRWSVSPTIHLAKCQQHERLPGCANCCHLTIFDQSVWFGEHPVPCRGLFVWRASRALPASILCPARPNDRRDGRTTAERPTRWPNDGRTTDATAERRPNDRRPNGRTADDRTTDRRLCLASILCPACSVWRASCALPVLFGEHRVPGLV